VPEDISVVGFDDVALAAYVDPPLTTIVQSTAEMGRWAVDQLTRRLGRVPLGSGARFRGDEPAPHVVLPVRLEVRDSTGPAPTT
jgi:LacI family repressor for deo operon, udp, cdd, tsx, nupC, and nupG